MTRDNINEYGRFDELKATVDKQKAQDYFTEIDGLPKKIPLFRVNNRVDQLLTDFILSGGMDVPKPKGESIA